MTEQPASETSVPDCPFCEKAADPNRFIVGEGVTAFEPLNPVTPGHVLVVPDRHVKDATTIPILTGIVMEAAARVARRVLGGQANIITSIGPDATQTVFHFHVHVVPRMAEDGLALPWTGQVKA